MTSIPIGPAESYETDRHFQVWRFTVSHSQLLLRSVKGRGHSTRIDVLFKGVDTIELPTSFDGLRIERNGERYTVSGPGWSGHVTATACFRAEDDGKYFDPSPFAASFGDEA
jgi:hypothetical protein